jgi:vitamin B12 transporter
VADALRHVPGITVNRAGSFGGLTDLRVRGAEANQVLVRINGVEVAQPYAGGAVDFSSLLATDVDRIEVLRGPQSGLYGADALAGVVNIITRRGGAPRASASFEGGAFDTWQGTASASGSLGAFDGAAALSYRDTGGINTSPVGDERDADDNLTLLMRTGYELNEALRFDAFGRYLARQSEVDEFDFSGGPNQGLSIDADSFSDVEETDVGGSATLSLLDARWISIASATYSGGQLDGGGPFGPYGYDASRVKLAAQSTFEWIPGDAAGSRHLVTGFVEHEVETYRNSVPFDPSQVPELDREAWAIGMEYRLDLFDNLFLSGIVRRDDNDDFEDATTFRLTAAYLVDSSNTRLHASYGTGVTNPSFFEQFGFTPGQFTGNPALEPEKSSGWDAGVEQRWFDGRVRADLTYFAADLHDEITSVFPTVINASGDSERRGAELVFTAEPVDALSFSAAYTYTDAEDPDGTREVRWPRHMASADLSYRFLDGRAAVNIGVTHGGERLDNDFRRYYLLGFMSEKTPVEAYTVVNLSGSYRVEQWLEVFARVENLFDEHYAELIGYNTPGIAAFGGVRVAWSPR